MATLSSVHRITYLAATTKVCQDWDLGMRGQDPRE